MAETGIAPGKYRPPQRRLCPVENIILIELAMNRAQMARRATRPWFNRGGTERGHWRRLPRPDESRLITHHIQPRCLFLRQIYRLHSASEARQDVPARFNGGQSY